MVCGFTILWDFYVCECVYFYVYMCLFLSKRRVYWARWGGGEDLGGTGEEEPIIRIYYKKNM